MISYTPTWDTETKFSGSWAELIMEQTWIYWTERTWIYSFPRSL